MSAAVNTTPLPFVATGSSSLLPAFKSQALALANRVQELFLSLRTTLPGFLNAHKGVLIVGVIVLVVVAGASLAVHKFYHRNSSPNAEAPAPVETSASTGTEAPAPVVTTAPTSTEAPAPVETTASTGTEAPARVVIPTPTSVSVSTGNESDGEDVVSELTGSSDSMTDSSVVVVPSAPSTATLT